MTCSNDSNLEGQIGEKRSKNWKRFTKDNKDKRDVDWLPRKWELSWTSATWKRNTGKDIVEVEK